MIQEDVFIRTCAGKRLSQLLHDPIGSRTASDVEVQDLATPMFNHEEAVQEPESESGDGEEIDSDDCLTMVCEEGEPAFARIPAPSESAQLSCNCAFGDFEAEFQQFAMDLGPRPSLSFLSPKCGRAFESPG